MYNHNVYGVTSKLVVMCFAKKLINEHNMSNQ